MSREIYRYVFSRQVPITEAMATLELTLIAVESLHGESRTRMDARCTVSLLDRTLEIDASTHVGQALNQIFVGYLTREFGANAYSVSAVAPGAKQAASPSSGQSA